MQPRFPYQAVLLLFFLQGACSESIPGPNRRPIALAGPDLAAVVESPTTLDGRSSYDPDGDELNYSWTLVVAPDGAGATLVQADQSQASLTPDVAGKWIVKLTVDDGKLYSLPDVIQVVAGGGCTSDADCQNDELWCNGQQTCQNGTCVNNQPDCSDNDPCTQDLCDEEQDQCLNPPVSEPPGSEGPQGDVSCTDQVDNDCDGLTDQEDPQCRPCEQDSDCQDNNVCTSDSCQQQGCRNEPVSDGLGCDDGLQCTTNDTCSSGLCGGEQVNCDHMAGPCAQGVCDEGMGDCRALPLGLGTPCEDGLFCTSGDSCDNQGQCLGGPDSPCTVICNTDCNEGQQSCDPDPPGTPCTDDGFECTENETCDAAGDCVGGDALDANCPAGEVCRPRCFAGPSGCGQPPSYMSLSCNPQQVNVSQDPDSHCTIDLDGLPGQQDCLDCQLRTGVFKLFHTDFENDLSAGQCSLDGWTLVTGPQCHNAGTSCPMAGLGSRNCCGSLVCPITAGALRDYVALEANKSDCGDEQWRLQRTVNASQLSDLTLCFQYASNDATNNEAVQVAFSDAYGNSQENAWCDIEGPRKDVDDRWYRVCVDLPDWADDNPHLTIDLFIQSNDNDDRIFIDDINLSGLWQSCPATRDTFFVEDFGGCDNPLTTLLGWTVTGDLDCVTGFNCFDGSRRMEANNNSGAIERYLDVSPFQDLTLCFYYGDHDADSNESLLVEFDPSGDGSGWWPAWSQSDKAGPNDSCHQICVNLTELDPSVNHNPALGLRFSLVSTSADERLDLDQISLTGARTCDASSVVQLSAPADGGGGSYTFTAGASQGDTLQTTLLCFWDQTSPGQELGDKQGLYYRDWWDTNWARRMRLSFDNSAASEDLDDFPIMIRLDHDRIDYQHTDALGQDLRFVDPDGTELPYQIERWDQEGYSEIWVRVPRIDGASMTDFIWLYYDRPGATSAQSPAQVWAPDHQAVWHLHADELDSTTNANNCTNSSSTDAGGYIAQGQEFDGSSHLDCGNGAGLQQTDAITVEAWVNTAALDGVYRPIVTKGDYSWGLKMSEGDDFEFFVYDTSWNRSFSNDSAPTGLWRWVVGTYNGQFVRLYVDGQIQDSSDTATQISLDANPVHIGHNSVETTRFFEGVIDEVRISRVRRSNSWIMAQYLSMTDAFVTYGQEELW